GDRIPGIPLHSIKGLLEFATPTRIKDSDTPPTMRIGAEWSYSSSRYLRGDESNEDDPLGGYFLLNLYTEYRPLPSVGLFLRIDNVLDKEYETFGLYGEADEVPALEARDYGSRFVSPGAPRAGYLGIRISM
ncbi:MAG: TonB-dependent receptor, partial [Gammaproteobacteria bacterium]|nr:TonB-dependent receptor [Gammaproteobacteria bacterium]